MVRERSEIERLLTRAYDGEPPVDRLMPGLATVASALNANDQCLARIAAVHLQIPDLASPAVRDALAAENSLIKYAGDESAAAANWNPALHPRTGTPPNPGWFAPTDDQSPGVQTAANDDPKQGSDAEPPGEERLKSKIPKTSSSPPVQIEREVARPPIEGEIIRPPTKGESSRPPTEIEGEIVRTPLEIELEVARAANRRAFRITAVAVLRMSVEAAANIVPILDAIADVMLAYDAVNLVARFN